MTKIRQSDERPFFLWSLYFADVFEKGGFDIVIGNPPYVDIKALESEVVKYLFKHFKTTKNRINLYAVFTEFSFFLLKNKGVLSFIIPNSILLNSSYSKLRKLLVDSVIEIIKLPDSVFVNASVETIIISVLNDKIKRPITGSCYKHNEKIDFESLNLNNFQRGFWKNDIDNKFNIFISKEKQNTINYIKNIPLTISDCFDFSLGITPYDKYKGHSKEDIKNKVFHSETPKDNSYKPLISGSNVVRYVVKPEIKGYIKYGEHLGAPRQEAFFINPRVIVRQIISGNPPRIYAGYTDKPLYHTQIGFSILSKNGNENELKLLCLLLNSSVINFYHKYEFTDIEKQVFQKILIQNCKRIPFTPHESVIPTLLYSYISNLLEHQSQLLVDANTITAFENLIDAFIFELYFPSEFSSAGVEIGKYVERDFAPILDTMSDAEKSAVIQSAYALLADPSHDISRNMSLMYEALGDLLEPILAL